MKRIPILLAAVLVPLSAPAMKPLNEADLSGISGQSGVSMFVDITMNIHISTIAWGDSDGLGAGPDNPWGIQTSGGYVGASNLTVQNLAIRSYYPDVFPNSVSFWPEGGTIDVVNGIPYYRVHVGPGRE